MQGNQQSVPRGLGTVSQCLDRLRESRSLVFGARCLQQAER